MNLRPLGPPASPVAEWFSRTQNAFEVLTRWLSSARPYGGSDSPPSTYLAQRSMRTHLQHGSRSLLRDGASRTHITRSSIHDKPKAFSPGSPCRLSVNLTCWTWRTSSSSYLPLYQYICSPARRIHSCATRRGGSPDSQSRRWAVCILHRYATPSSVPRLC